MRGGTSSQHVAGSIEPRESKVDYVKRFSCEFKISSNFQCQQTKNVRRGKKRSSKLNRRELNEQAHTEIETNVMLKKRNHVFNLFQFSIYKFIDTNFHSNDSLRFAVCRTINIGF